MTCCPEREALPDCLGDWMEQRVPELAQAEAWPGARAELGADVNPVALTVTASVEDHFAAIDDNLARAQAGFLSGMSSRPWSARSANGRPSTSLLCTPTSKPNWRPPPSTKAEAEADQGRGPRNLSPGQVEHAADDRIDGLLWPDEFHSERFGSSTPEGGVSVQENAGGNDQSPA